MKRYSFEERLGLVKQVKSGYPIKRLAKERGVGYLFVRCRLGVRKHLTRPNHLCLKAFQEIRLGVGVKTL